MHNHELRRWSPALLVAGLASSVLMFPVVAQASAPVGGPEAARIAQLEAEVAELKTIVEALVSKSAVKTPSWGKAPETSDDSSDFTFKPRGRLMYDVGFLSNPDDAIVTRNLGFQSRARRVRLGAEGNIAGGFGYQFEIDYANAAIGFGNVVLTYAPKNRPYVFTFGNHETLNGLEQMTSSRFLSFVERAAFNEAFINTRRIGLSAGLANSDNSLRLNAGLFTAHGIDGSFDNDGWIGAARASYAPRSTPIDRATVSLRPIRSTHSPREVQPPRPATPAFGALFLKRAIISPVKRVGIEMDYGIEPRCSDR